MSKSALEHLSKTRSFDDKLFIRQQNLDLMIRFMKVKSINPKMKKKEIGK